MPESSFTNTIALSEISVGKFVTDTMLTKFRARDIELMDRMSIFGGPTSTGAGSAVSYEGDVTIAANQNLSGLHYYNNLTINSGITVTANEPLIIMARGTVDFSGATITADGCGALGGDGLVVASHVGKAGAAGGAGGAGGGGGGSENSVGAVGGAGANRTAGGAGGTTFGGSGSNAGAAAALTPLAKLMLISNVDYSELGGGGGAHGSADNNSLGAGPGGNGGGIIVIIAPTIIGTGGILTARGTVGAAGGGNASGAGGGGGGLILVRCKSWAAPSTLSVDGGVGGVSAAQGDGSAGAGGVKQIDIYA